LSSSSSKVKEEGGEHSSGRINRLFFLYTLLDVASMATCCTAQPTMLRGIANETSTGRRRLKGRFMAYYSSLDLAQPKKTVFKTKYDSLPQACPHRCRFKPAMELRPSVKTSKQGARKERKERRRWDSLQSPLRPAPYREGVRCARDVVGDYVSDECTCRVTLARTAARPTVPSFGEATNAASPIVSHFAGAGEGHTSPLASLTVPGRWSVSRKR
jgi:hypothetical protein